MDVMVVLIPAALSLAGLGLAAFFWTLRSGQYDDLDGAAARILIDDDDDECGPANEANGHDRRK
jgi:cbb3-type cytochrome oxidase maturation protein